jgi:hypothetical protein
MPYQAWWGNRAYREVYLMGNRREPRTSIAIPVRIFGTDRDGRMFSENVTTLDVSQTGVKLGGVKASLRVDETIGLAYGKNRVQFRVRWVGIEGTASAGMLGLLNQMPGKPLWDFPIPHYQPDTFRNLSIERRRWPRVKHSISVEVRQVGQAIIWARASDISQGGCFVEMAIPLAIGQEFDIALWLRETKLPLRGRVVNVAPGFGNGVCFLNSSPQMQEQLRHFIENITQKGRGASALVQRSGA